MLNLRRPPLSLLAGYMLFAAFMVLESLARQGAAAKDATPGKEDRGTTRMLGTAHWMGVLLVPIAARLRPSRALPSTVLGPLVMLAAIGLRMWAAMTLGRFYTRTLRTARGRDCRARWTLRLRAPSGVPGHAVDVLDRLRAQHTRLADWCCVWRWHVAAIPPSHKPEEETCCWSNSATLTVSTCGRHGPVPMRNLKSSPARVAPRARRTFARNGCMPLALLAAAL